jgi:hypothetical protein
MEKKDVLLGHCGVLLLVEAHTAEHHIVIFLLDWRQSVAGPSAWGLGSFLLDTLPNQWFGLEE